MVASCKAFRRSGSQGSTSLPPCHNLHHWWPTVLSIREFRRRFLWVAPPAGFWSCRSQSGRHCHGHPSKHFPTLNLDRWCLRYAGDQGPMRFACSKIWLDFMGISWHCKGAETVLHPLNLKSQITHKVHDEVEFGRRLEGISQVY